MNRKTAKSLGFKKGDFVYTGAFPAIIISDAHTATPCCEVWGFEHESGSVYAHDLKMLHPEEFKALTLANGHQWPLQAYAKSAKDAIQALTHA